MSEEEPTLSDIEALGGTAEDFDLFKTTGSKKQKSINYDELKQFARSIGISPIKERKKSKAAEKRKRLEKDGPSDHQAVGTDPKTNKAVKKARKEATEQNSFQLDKQFQKNPKNQILKLHSDKNTNRPKKKRTRKEESTPVALENLEAIGKDAAQADSSIHQSSEDQTAYSNTIGEQSPLDKTVFERLMKVTAGDHHELLAPVNPDSAWFEEADSPVVVVPIPPSVVTHLHEVGAELMEKEIRQHNKARQKKKGRDVQWLKTVLSSGTLSDKMAAMTLLIQESPVHSLRTVDALLSMAGKKNKRESLLAVDTLKQLWISDLLPNNRKLKHLRQRPVQLLVENQNSQSCNLRSLLLWYYEDQLKDRYTQYLSIVQGLLHDPLCGVREKSLGSVFDLLYQKPEQEQFLLSQLVNKLGDPNCKVSSKSIIFLLKLLNHHVQMKMIVVKEVETLLYRSNISQKAQYYAVCFLNQVVFGHNDVSLAMKLVNIYFSFFKVFTQREQYDAKILSGLLTGLNRALPFLRDSFPSLEGHLDSLFKIVHVGPLATGVQALHLLYLVMEASKAVSARYYRALYQKLLDPQLCVRSAQQAMFLNVLFKSLKSDPELNRVKAFLKRILQTCVCHSAHFVCGCLALVSEVLRQRPSLWSFVLQSESFDQEEHFVDVDNSDDGDSSTKEVGWQDKEDIAPESFPAPVELSQPTYMISHREPLYSKAETSCLWEMAMATVHYHPSVQVFAKTLAKGGIINYPSDPLQDFTLTNFLDQFIHKNPKRKPSDHGGSLMQPTSQLVNAPVVRPTPAELTKMEEEKVREDLLFIHQFLKRRAECRKAKSRLEERAAKEGERGSDVDAYIDSDEDIDFAGEMEKLAKSKKAPPKKKSKKTRANDDSDFSENDFSYSDLSISDFEDNAEPVDSFSDDESEGRRKRKQAKKGKPSDAELENLLLENMSSEDEDVIEKEPQTRRGLKRKGITGSDGASKRAKFDTSSLFAAADEFAHLLDNSDGNTGKGMDKQRQWENKRSFSFSRGRGGRQASSRWQDKEGKASDYHQHRRTEWQALGKQCSSVQKTYRKERQDSSHHQGKKGRGLSHSHGRGRFGSGPLRKRGRRGSH